MGNVKFNNGVKTKILERLLEGRSLRAICRDSDIPVTPAAVRKCVKRDKSFGTQYARARDLGLDAMVEEMLEIADDARKDWELVTNKDGATQWKFNHENVQRSRLRCDVLKWYISKLAPKRYGKNTKSISCKTTLDELTSDEANMRLSQILNDAKTIHIAK